MTNPFYDPYRILTRVYSDGAHLKIALSEEPIEELHRARTTKTVYGVLENDAYLSYCIRSLAQKAPKQSVRTVLKIALYHLIFLKKAKYAVTDTAVELLKKLGKGGAAGFANALLRAFDEEKITLPEGDEGLAIRYNYPLFVVKKLKAQYGERAEAIMGAKSGGVSVRFVADAEEYLHLPHTKTPFPNVYLFEKFTRDGSFFEGKYTFQSVGSVAVASVVDTCENLLDACAAPGGKSVLLSERCKKVTACELHEHRAELIKSYLSRMKATNVEVVCCDSSLFRPEWEGGFDAVLCDVPCSGLGTLAENPDLALFKREEDLKGLGATQLAIAFNCARYVKRGGYLYYATCSILEEENDAIVQKILAETGFEAVGAESPLPHDVTRFGLQFLPDTAYGAGFYVAKLRKI